TLNQQGGGSLNAPLSSYSARSLSFVIPAGAASGPLMVTSGTQNLTSASSLIITTSSTFSLRVSPSSANLIPGQSVAYAVSVSSTTGFSGLATLALTGLPSGVTANFKPSAVSAGQISVLTLAAPA